MTQSLYNVLFVCTGNTARSILAEGLLNALGDGRFAAYSAGSFPKGVVNPYAIQVLEDLGIDTEGMRSKSWDEFTDPHAPQLDLVVTVCDNAAGEVCPVWPGGPMTVHWGVEDPAAATGTPDEILSKFNEVAAVLRRRIELFVALPQEALEHLPARSAELRPQLDAIGKA